MLLEFCEFMSPEPDKDYYCNIEMGEDADLFDSPILSKGGGMSKFQKCRARGLIVRTSCTTYFPAQ